MHSPPIDLLNNAPKPQKAAPTESEPDGRFSELLRAPAEAEPTRPDSGTAPKSNPAVATEDRSQAEAATELPVDSGPQVAAEPVAPAAIAEPPQAEKTGIAPLAVVPRAITWVEPQGGPVPGNAAAAPLASPSGEALPQTSAPAAGAITAPVPAAPSDGVAAPAQTPTSGVIGTPGVPQAQTPANPVDGGGVKAGPIEPGNPGAIATVPTGSSPVASTQPLMATAAPVVASGKSLAGGAVPGETPRPSATAPTAMETTADTVLSDRPASAPNPAPGRLAAAQTPTPGTGEPPAPKEMSELPSTTVSKAVADPGKAAAAISAATTSAPKAVAPPATAALTADKTTATPATTIPSTVAETADAAVPQAGQADPVATANSGPTGRMNVTAASSATLAHAPSTAQPAAEQVVLQVQRAVREGVDRLTMQLKPVSLGRVDIQMEVGFDGRLQAVISAERPETLHLLQRDARMLADALNAAGLQTDSGSLSFNLRGQAGDHGGGNGNEPTRATAATRPNLADESAAATTEITLTLGDGRVDIKV